MSKPQDKKKFTCMNVVEAANLQPGEERGEDLAYRCPQHKPDNNPSLLVNEQKDCWLCGPCDEKGNAWALAAFIAGVSPDDKPAVTKWLAEHKLISVKKKQPQKILAVYPYRNLNGDVVFETVRYEPKDFRQRRPDPNGDGYIWNLDGVETIPYRLDEIAKKSAVFLVEGEKDADRLWECGLAASTSPQGAGKWRERYNVYFKGKTVVILPDADEPGKSHAQDVARQLVPVAESVRIIELPGLSRKGDVSDWLDAGHTKEELRALVKATPALKAEGIPPIESTAVTLTDVEKLFEELRLKASELLRNGAEPLQVEMARASLTKFLEGRHLKSLGVTSPAKLVDAAIAQCRQNTVTSESVVEDTIPWDEPVDGSALLQELASRFTRHLVLPAGASTALALWTVHTHALEAAHHTPTLALLSPERRCGKTTALDTLSGLVNRSLATSNVSPAALFRSIEKFSPTLLVDEFDSFGDAQEELRGVLNSGHSRTSAFVIRCVGEDHQPKRFNTWAAKCIALIGKLPVTLSDRSITIPMRRKGPKEHIEKFRLRKFRPELNRLRSQAARWVQDNLETLNSVEPAIPEGLHDRAVDNWTPLLCIADVLGGEWPEEARKAALLLSAESVTSEDESLRVQLLGHIRDIFREDPTNPFIPSAELITKLTEDKDSPWAEYRNGKELTVRQQAVLLAPFGIRPKLVRLGDRVQRGYLRGDFVDAWGRYLPPPPPRSVTTATSEAGTASAGKPGSVTQRLRNGSSNPPKSKPVQRSNAGNGSKEGGVDGVLRSASPYHDRTDSI